MTYDGMNVWCDKCYIYALDDDVKFFFNTLSKEQRIKWNKVCIDCRWHWQCKNATIYKGESPLNFKEKGDKKDSTRYEK